MWVVSGGLEKWDGPEKSLSISLESVQLFAVWVPPFPSWLNLWGPLRAKAPCEEEDSNTTPVGLRPACRVACMVLHIFNLQRQSDSTLHPKKHVDFEKEIDLK